MWSTWKVSTGDCGVESVANLVGDVELAIWQCELDFWGVDNVGNVSLGFCQSQLSVKLAILAMWTWQPGNVHFGKIVNEKSQLIQLAMGISYEATI
jgi:hypothetical protein